MAALNQIQTPKSIWSSDLIRRLALPSILGWALTVRLWDLGQPFIGDYAWNEVYYAYIARSFNQGDLLVQYDLFQGTLVRSSPLVPWLIYGSFRLFGTVEWAARLPFLVFGLAALVILFLLVRTLYGHRLALAATFLTSTVPGIVFFSRNVQLDGIMTTFGLGALLAMVLFRRDRRRVWLGISLTLFALAILAKYTAVLFCPALFWAWFDNSVRWRNRRCWLGLISYTVVALAPAVLWLVFMPKPDLAAQSVPPAGSGSAYFIRFGEWSLNKFKDAFLSLWPNTSRHLGLAVWYPSILLGGVALAKTRSVKALETVRKYTLPILIVVPWYLQIGYPSSWLANEYYDYPALFAICILLAALGLATFEYIVAWLNLDGHRLRIVIILSIGVVLFSNAWDYKAFYHGSYYPWPIIDQPTSYYSARRVAALNVDHKPVLTDLPFTLYYTEADPGYGKLIWWFRSDAPTIEAIKSREFEFIVFTYPPTINIIDAIYASGYERIAPAAWHKLPVLSD